MMIAIFAILIVLHAFVLFLVTNNHINKAKDEILKRLDKK